MTKFIELTEISTPNEHFEYYRESKILLNLDKISYIAPYKYKSDGVGRDTVIISFAEDTTIFVKESYEYIIRELGY